MRSFNPRPTSFLGVLAWAATEARLKGVPFCPLAGERVDGHAVEWLSESFDSMSPTHRYTVDVTDLATGKVTSFAKVWRKSRTYRATGRTTVTYSTPLGSFRTFDEVNAALVAEAQRRVAEALAAAGEMQAAPGGDASDSETQGAEMHSDTPTQGEGVPVYPAPALENPVTGPAYLPYHVGPFEQPEQRHYAVAEAAPADALPTAEEVIAELVTCVEAQAAVDLALDAGAVQGDIVQQEEVATRSLNWLMDLPGAHLRQLGAQAARDAALLAAYEEALTPSAGTKYAYSGEFKIEVEELDEEGCPTVVRHDVDWMTLKDVLAAVRARVQARVNGPHEQPEQQQAQRVGELFLRPSVAMLVEYRFARQDGGLILPEQRVRLDDGMFELIGEFAQANGLNVEGQALFEHPEGPTAQVEQQQAQALAVAVAGFEPECDRCGALLDERGGCSVCGRLPDQQAEAAYPEEGYRQLAEGLRRLAAGRHAQTEQQQRQGEGATCTNCDAPRADPRQRCRTCREPVCVQCATYDEDGTLFCPECAAADGGGFDDLGLDL